MFASEPMFIGNWQQCPEQHLIEVGGDRELHFYPIPTRNFAATTTKLSATNATVFSTP
jgi:hypothetical protein